MRRRWWIPALGVIYNAEQRVTDPAHNVNWGGGMGYYVRGGMVWGGGIGYCIRTGMGLGVWG